MRTLSRSSWPRAAVAALLAATGLGICPTAHAAGANYFTYQVPLPAPPKDGDTAVATLDTRAQEVLRAVACGLELDFGVKLEDWKSDEDSTAVVIGKMEWAAGHPGVRGVPRVPSTCQFTRTVRAPELCRFYATRAECDTWVKAEAFGTSFRTKPEWSALREGTFTGLNDLLKSRLPTDCGGPHAPATGGLFTSEPDADPSDGVIVGSRAWGDDVQLDFKVTRACLIGQLNLSIIRMRRQGQLGSAGAPCGLFGTTEGDWDMAVRNLTRIAYLDERYEHRLLIDFARTHLQEQLLSVDGGPAEETYSLIGCGNTEESTGSSQERNDEDDWLDDLGEFLEDLLKWLAIIVLIAVVAAALVAAGAVAAGAAVAVAAVGVLAVTGIDVPETENHLLMINTSKYLKNQFIIRDLGPGSDDAEDWEEYQAELREWFLERFQEFLQTDFVEYNSRPYQRLSINAILNIADFAEDETLRTGARMVLDYSTAKFAVGSNQGRRFVPFRRKREDMRQRIDSNAPEFNGLFDLTSGADHQVALGLLFAGQTQQLPGGRVSFGAAEQAVYATTSTYHPDPLVIDLAIRKDVPFYQRIHHFTGEVYSSGRGYLISAGGAETGLAYSGSGIEFLDIALVSKLRDDLGVAMPITLFLTGYDPNLSHRPPPPPDVSRSRITLGDLLRIEGRRPDDAEYPSYDHNLCVWNGFACGLNVIVPPELDFEPGCMKHGPPGSAPQWGFIDTSLCPAYDAGPRTFIAVYRDACRNSDSGCVENFGFFEVVDAEPNDSFEAFQAGVVQRNPHGFISSIIAGGGGGDLTLPMAGLYTSARGEQISFDCEAHQEDSDDWGIRRVDNSTQPELDDWPFAGGDPALHTEAEAPMTASGDGRVVIWNPRLGARLELDFRDREHPVRQVH